MKRRDENPDLQKQIGCMNGIFQLLDRHHIFTGKRINRRLPSGNSHCNNGNLRAEADTGLPQTAKEKNPGKNPNKNQRPLIESSCSSFSSSPCSSSFSSRDCNKTAHSDSPPIERTTFPEQSLTNPHKLQNPEISMKPNDYVPLIDPPNAPAQFGRQLLDFRDLVKDSICRETGGLSVKTRVREDPVGRGAKHDDSPRPSQLHKSMDEFNGTINMPVDINESLRVLAKLKQAPRYFSKSRDPSRLSCEMKDGSLGSQDAPRFSYDGQEIPRRSFDSGNACKSTTKLGELPRLSLDGREHSAKSSNLDSKSAKIFNQRISSSKEQYQQQELASCKRLPCVIAKLMGLETGVNSNSSTTQRHASMVKTCLDKDRAPFYRERNSNCVSRSPRANEENKPDQIPCSPSSSVKDPVSLRLRNRDVITKPTSSSRFPIEPAPWRQQDNCHSPEKTGYGKREACSVSALSKGTNVLRPVESSIVIMKPVKSIDRSTVHSSVVIPIDRISIARKFKTNNSIVNKKNSMYNQTAIDLSRLQEPGKKTDCRIDEKNSQKIWVQPTQISSKTISLPRENTISSTRNSCSLSPRMQQKKSELEKKSYLPIPSSDSSKCRRKPVKQEPELGSPGGKRRPKAGQAPQNNDQLSAISSKTRNLRHQGGELPLQPDNNISWASQVDIQVASTDNMVSSFKHKKSPSSLKEDGLLAELTKISTEQPSPISVLDGSFYKDDLTPSPMNNISSAFQDDDTCNSNNISSDDGWNLMGNSRVNHKKLENMEHLVQTPRQLKSIPHKESTTEHNISSPWPCETINADQMYVSKILLASGLLLEEIGLGFTPIPRLHPFDHPINPELFFVLEQTKANWHSSKLDKEATHKKALRSKPDQEKLHRKLLFDTVNEIFVGKLKLSRGIPFPCGQRLLIELYSEIERLQQANSSEDCIDDKYDWLNSIVMDDVMRGQGESWTDFHKEVADLVLDVERLIFKDLIDELVSSELLIFRAKPNRRHRQLCF